MHVVDRLELAAALADIAEQLLARYLSGDRLLHVACSDGCGAHAADGHRGTRDPAAIIGLDEHRGRRDRKIAVPPGEFDEGMAVPGCPLRKPDADEKLVRLDRRRHIADREFGKRQLALAIATGDGHGRVVAGGERNQFRCRIEMTKRAADRPAIAGLAMTDLQRLEGLLDHATGNLLERFGNANRDLAALENARGEDLTRIRHSLHQAVTELQFHDMATQLLAHTGKMLKGCAWRLAEQAMAPDEDEEPAPLDALPERPSPVTQSEMDAGSVELF